MIYVYAYVCVCCTARPREAAALGVVHGVAASTLCGLQVLQGEAGKPIKHAGPSTPVRVSGFRELPRAGDEFLVVGSEVRAREVCEYRKERRHVQDSLLTRKSVGRTRKSAKLVPFLLKADTQGTQHPNPNPNPHPNPKPNPNPNPTPTLTLNPTLALALTLTRCAGGGAAGALALPQGRCGAHLRAHWRRSLERG